MEQLAGIRRDHGDRDLSIRGWASKHRVHRCKGRAGPAHAVPAVRKVPERTAPVLIGDLDGPHQQRHTARRARQRLIEEEGAQVAESTVRNMVERLRTTIGARGAQLMNGATRSTLGNTIQLPQVVRPGQVVADDPQGVRSEGEDRGPV